MNEDDLPLRLKSAAYRSETGEPAWLRDDTIAVIEWVRDRGLAVLGGEVWLGTQPGPTIPGPHVYQWTVLRREHESWIQFVNRSADESVEYVRSFAWADDDGLHRIFVPYFTSTSL